MESLSIRPAEEVMAVAIRTWGSRAPNEHVMTLLRHFGYKGQPALCPLAGKALQPQTRVRCD